MGNSYMQYYRNFFYNFRKYGMTLSAKEIKSSIATILFMAFVLSFRQWGDETFNFMIGLVNFLKAALICAVCIFVNQLGQRLIGVYYGYNPEFEISTLGIMISLVVCFASRGLLVVLAPGYIVIHMLAASRLGEFRYYTNLWEWAKTCFGGPLFNFVLACLLSFIPGEIPFVKQMIWINIMFALWSLAPIPTFPGMYMFWHRQFFWAFGVGFVVGGAILLYVLNGIVALVGAGIFGGIAMYYMFVVSDNKLAI
ncbi:MAG: hypothetical protein KKF44_10850 [Nanoarchaeota archaeon]|nr:hypothetical protein [Nanoarchaeota archaeon]